MKKIYFSIIMVVALLLLGQVHAKAVEVNSEEGFIAAFNDIHTHSNENFTIELTSDIAINSALPAIDNGNTVTILGNNHKLSLLAADSGVEGKIRISGGTLNLGNAEGSDTLNIVGKGKTGNTAESIIAVANGTVNMNNGVTLSENYGQALTGGAVRIETSGTFNMKGGTIKDNGSLGAGVAGAIMMDYNNGTFNMTGGEIKDNYSAMWGGAIYTDYSASNLQVTIKNGTISGNKAVYGGAIAALGGTILVEDSIIENNEVVNTSQYSSIGGAIIGYYFPSITMKRNTIRNNTSEADGGAIACMDLVTFNLEGNTITGNSALRGGGIFGGAGRYEYTINSSNDIITLNTADSGGGVYLGDGEVEATGNFATTKVYNNKATTKGNDYFITNKMKTLSIIDASSIGEKVTLEDTEIDIDGWYKDEEENRYSPSNVTDIVPYSTVSVKTEYSLTAAANVYEAKFETDNGTEINSQVIVPGGKVTKPSNPTKDGYTFVGWYTDNTFSTEFDFTASINSSVMIYAKWNKNSSDDEESSDDSKSEDSKEEKEENNEVKNNELKATKTGDYGIMGWIAIIAVSLFIINRIKKVSRTKRCRNRSKRK